MWNDTARSNWCSDLLHPYWMSVMRCATVITWHFACVSLLSADVSTFISRCHFFFPFFSFLCHSALRLVGQGPEPSQATDMTLACCFLGKVLGVGCHYFPPAFRHSNLRRQVPPHLHDARDPSSKGWNNGREYCPVNLAEMMTSTPFLDLLHTANYDMGPTALLPLRRKACWGFFALKVRRLRPGLNPRTGVPEDSTLTPRPPKPLCHL